MWGWRPAFPLSFSVVFSPLDDFNSFHLKVFVTEFKSIKIHGRSFVSVGALLIEKSLKGLMHTCRIGADILNGFPLNRRKKSFRLLIISVCRRKKSTVLIYMLLTKSNLHRLINYKCFFRRIKNFPNGVNPS